MIGYVKGILADREDNTATIDVNGFGVNVIVSESLLYELPSEGSEVKLYTYTYVKEDAFHLYGFRSKDELGLFKQLISVSGIGPKGGLAILSVLGPEDLRFAIYSGDSKTIAKAPGIGKKTAERLVLELKDKVSILDNDGDVLLDQIASAEDSDGRVNRVDAIEALVALGYPRTEAAKAVKNVNPDDDMDVEAILKASLKYLL